MLDEGAYRPLDGDPRKPPRAIRVAGARAPVQAAIYDRAAMPAGLTFAGPAIVEQDDTTTLVEPGWRGDGAGQRQSAADARLHAMDVDPITLEVVRNKLDGIANEMQLTLVRSAFSPIVKEGLDASASLFTLHGETLAQALAIPIHLGALTRWCGRLLQTFRSTTMGEGDIWILNDTYLGGTHLPDIAIMMPVFADGRRDRDQRGDDAPPGCRRHGARLDADQRHRDLPGRHPHPAAASSAAATR